MKKTSVVTEIAIDRAEWMLNATTIGVWGGGMGGHALEQTGPGWLFMDLKGRAAGMACHITCRRTSQTMITTMRLSTMSQINLNCSGAMMTSG
jgi:hypothetical protein